MPTSEQLRDKRGRITFKIIGREAKYCGPSLEPKTDELILKGRIDDVQKVAANYEQAKHGRTGKVLYQLISHSLVLYPWFRSNSTDVKHLSDLSS